MISRDELYSCKRDNVNLILYLILENYFDSGKEIAECYNEGWPLTKEEIDDLNSRGVFLEKDHWGGPKNAYDILTKDFDEIEMELMRIKYKIVLCYLREENHFSYEIIDPIIVSIIKELGYNIIQLTGNLYKITI